MSVKAHELAIKLTSISEAVNQFGPWHPGTRADSKEYWLLQKQNILLSGLLTLSYSSRSGCFLSLLTTSLLGVSMTFRSRFLPKMLWECKY